MSGNVTRYPPINGRAMPNVGKSGVPSKPGANAANTGANAANTGANASKMKQAAEKAKQWWDGMMKNQGPLIIFLLAVLLVFIVVIIYITFALKNSNLKGKVLLSKPVKMSDLTVPYEIASSEIPKPAVGREYSLSFWVYVEAFEQTPNNHKLVFFRGATSDDLTNANPIVMMDATSNRMYVVIKTQDSVLKNLSTVVEGETASTASSAVATTNGLDLRRIVASNYFKATNPNPDRPQDYNKHIIMDIDYVPLQRWVNVAVVVDNKIVTVFLDGEIYSVKSTDELKAIHKPMPDSAGMITPMNLIVDKTDGDIFVGKNKVNDSVSVNGYISKLEFHNYAASIAQIKSMYNSGPLASGVLSSMGLQYGVRSPIYKLNENVK